MNELTKTNQNTEIADYKATAIEYLNNMGQQLPQNYATQFIELCQAFSLNPFKRECYAIAYGNKFNIITGYEVYIKRAERTGKLDGWYVELNGNPQNKNSMSAVITIYRKDWKMPFKHTVFYSECSQNNSIWQKMPSFMLKKVAIAQGFRLCFPDELGGMPYTSDELPSEEKNITNEATVVKSEPIQNEPKIENKKENQDNNPQVISNKFADLLQKYEKQLDKNYTTAYETYQTGSDSEMVAMYNRCVTYLGKKGIKVA